MYKFFIFCPNDNEIIESIINVASKAGAGNVGNYSHCAFVTEGYGTWFPLPGSQPTIGKVGKLSSEKEVKIEMECPKEQINEVLKAVKAIHPYEKISVDAVLIERFE